MSKLIKLIILLVLSIAVAVGVFLCGINIIDKIFLDQGSYVVALTGFLLITVGTCIIAMFKED